MASGSNSQANFRPGPPFARAILLLCLLGASPAGAQSQAPVAPPISAPTRLQELRQATSLVAHHQLEEAESILSHVLEQDPKEARAIELIGVIRAEQGKRAEAEQLFREAIEANPTLVAAHENLALLLVEEDRPDEAFAQFEAALQLKSESPRSRSGLASLAEQRAISLRRAGDRDGALTILVRVHGDLPEDAHLSCDLGILQTEMGRLSEALATFQTALKLAPEDPKLLYGLARVQMERQQMPDAEELMRRYLKLRPDDATAHYGLGRILSMLERHAEARAEFERSVALAPQQSESYYELGQIDLDQADFDRAGDEFSHTLIANPHHGGALTGLGIIAYRRKDYPQAISRLRSAVQDAPDYQPAHYYLGLSLSKSGQTEEGEQELKTAAELAARENDKRALRPQ
jgi:tetratricopeptide (TPR) repeat protein